MWKNRLTNYNFWISIVSAVLLILQSFDIQFDVEHINEIITAVLGLLVVIGIINDPTKSATSSSTTETLTGGDSSNSQKSTNIDNAEESENSSNADSKTNENATDENITKENVTNENTTGENALEDNTADGNSSTGDKSSGEGVVDSQNSTDFDTKAHIAEAGESAVGIKNEAKSMPIGVEDEDDSDTGAPANAVFIKESPAKDEVGETIYYLIGSTYEDDEKSNIGSNGVEQSNISSNESGQLNDVANAIEQSNICSIEERPNCLIQNVEGEVEIEPVVNAGTKQSEINTFNIVN